MHDDIARAAGYLDSHGNEVDVLGVFSTKEAARTCLDTAARTYPNPWRWLSLSRHTVKGMVTEDGGRDDT
jgi:hypothetical protein